MKSTPTHRGEPGADAPAAAPLAAAGATNPKRKASGYQHDRLGWYIEPSWCTDLLADQVQLERVWDPACGVGTIPLTLIKRGIDAVGSDIAVRPDHQAAVRVNGRWNFWPDPIDFLTCADPEPKQWTDVVTNPPFSLAEQFIRRAIELRARKIAVLVRLDFLGAQKRHKFFTDLPPSYVLILSRRPSMPPGELLTRGEVTAKGGQTDYCWLVWDAFIRGPDFNRFAQEYPTEMRWLK